MDGKAIEIRYRNKKVDNDGKMSLKSLFKLNEQSHDGKKNERQV